MRKLGTKKCKTCNTDFQQGYFVSVKKWETMSFCSLSCRRFTEETKLKMSIDTRNHPATKRGVEHHNWKGGVTKEHNKLRGSLEYINWRDSVYKRDRWECQNCGIHCKNGDIVAHHIRRFADFINGRFDVDNGMTLCRKCHCEIENPKNIVHV